MKLCMPNIGSLCFSFGVFSLLLAFLATADFHRVGLFTSVKLKTGYVASNQSRRQFPEMEVSSKWVEFQFSVNYCVAKQRGGTGCKGSPATVTSLISLAQHYPYLRCVSVIIILLDLVYLLQKKVTVQSELRHLCFQGLCIFLELCH